MQTGCTLCPRGCGADRIKVTGVCGVGKIVRLSRVGLHLWEEPCLSYGKGSGTVFFAGCPLKCVFCQNHEISRGTNGKDVSVRTLADEFLRLQEMGAVNINLVTPTHYADSIASTLDAVKDRLRVPVCYNCGGYEKPETLRMLAPYVDIFLPDFKYFSGEASGRYSAAPDYFDVVCRALETMYEIAGHAVFDGDGHMTKGVLTRHLVLPGLYRDSMKILDHLAAHYDVTRFAVSLMCQYVPTENCVNYPEINRRLTTLEYRKVVDHARALGFVRGFTQERDSAVDTYVPAFDYGEA